MPRTNRSGARIAGIVLSEAGRITVLGLGLGIALFWALARFLTGLVYGISPVDLTAMAGAAALLLVTALAAALAPAIQASRISPIVAIRQE